MAGAKFQEDANLEIIAKGEIISSSALAAQEIIDKIVDLKKQLSAAVALQTSSKKQLVTDYNLGVNKANEIYKNDEVKLLGLALHLSKESGVKVHIPTIIEGGKAAPSKHSGSVLVSFDGQKKVRVYMIMETTDLSDLMDESLYYPASPVYFLTAKGGDIVPKEKDKITWWRIYGVNNAGKGVWSAPFGGFSTH